ncbi:MAG TPA: extracellular solute-binding protein [Fimbriimonadaceae bacterium]|nr:extracellular solute-binding protein [Fimbriimonadaceae bacterium]
MRQLRYLLTGLGLIASACALGAEKRELVIWGISVGPETKGADAVIREFERRNPEVRVRLLSMGAGRMDPQKLMTSIVGNVAPDVINQDRFSIADWASRGAFRPLDDLIERDKNDPLAPRKEGYYPAPWREAQYEGKIYAIPNSSDNRILYLNREIFLKRSKELREAGLDPMGIPKTWSELLAYSKVLTEFNKDGSLKTAGFMPNYGNTWLYLYAFQMNASFMSADGRKCTLYTPESEEALNFMIRGYDILRGFENAKKFESGFLGKENDAFIVGKVAMKIDGDWIINDLSRYGPQVQLEVAPAPVPDDRFTKRGRFKGEKDTFITWFGGFSLAIPKGARNVQDAWEYIKFATSTEGRMFEMREQAKWERLRGRQFIPRQIANIEANLLAGKEFRPADKKFAAAVDMHTQMAPFGRIRPPTFVGTLLWSEQVKALETACYKKMSPKDALLAGQSVVQRELDAFFEKDKYPVIEFTKPMWGVGLLTAGLLTWLILRFRKLPLGRLERAEAKWGYLLLSPWIIGFLVLTLGPMVASFIFSFTQYDVLNEARWVGGKNYADMFSADWLNVSKALGNAAYMAFVGVPLGLATGLAVALLLNSATRGMRFYRTFFYMPSIVPVVASAVLWSWVLSADPNKGLINAGWAQTISQWMNLSPPGGLQSADWSKPAMITMGLWGAGSGMLLWLAGLKGVSSTLYEAAGIDGANPTQTFWKITFPQLSPIIFFNAVMGFIGAMQEFERMYIMKPSSDGPIGPDDTLLTPVYLLFKNGFSYFKMGYASSLAWLIFGIILVLTLIQFRLAPKWVHYETDK